MIRTSFKYLLSLSIVLLSGFVYLYGHSQQSNHAYTLSSPSFQWVVCGEDNAQTTQITAASTTSEKDTCFPISSVFEYEEETDKSESSNKYPDYNNYFQVVWQAINIGDAPKNRHRLPLFKHLKALTANKTYILISVFRI